MRDAAHLTGVAVLFASGTAELNRAALERFASDSPGLPLVVVAEFEPAAGEWIPFHVQRSRADNVAAIRAALAGRPIARAAAVLARGTGLKELRRAAMEISGARLSFFDGRLRTFGWSGLPAHSLREMMRSTGENSPARRWLRRLAHPREAEIPVRAQWAQLYGALASRVRAQGKELPLGGCTPLESGVTVVVPTRDGKDLLAQLLPSLVPQLGRGEIIVVDNGSRDGMREWLASEYPDIRAIVTAAPLSFARAINAGVVEARFNRLLMLNNDMVAEPGFVDALHGAFAKVPELFCATAQIFFPEGVRREETGKAVWRRESPLDFPVRCDEPLPGEDLTWVLYGSGGCSMFDTARLRELGGVSEVYEPAYVEDMDFGYRAWKRGWPSVYCAGARVEHRHRATTSRFFSPRELDFFVERNYLRFLIHAVGSQPLFAKLWSDAVRRLQLRAMQGDAAALDALRDVPHIGPRPSLVSGPLSEEQILALGNGDAAAFPGTGAERVRTVVVASPYVPYPLSHGGAVRMFNLIRESADEFGIVLIAFCDELQTPAPELLAVCREVVLVKRHGSHYRKDTQRPDMVEEFDSLAFRACLRQTCERWKPGVLQLEFTWMAQYADAYPAARTVLVEHDITFDLHRQLAKSEPTWERQQQLAKWERFERAAWRKVDCVVTMSGKDKAAVEGAARVDEIPNGVDCSRFQPSADAPEPRRLLFIGSFAHLPNVLALEWFAKEVWPLLEDEYTLHVIAGANHTRFSPQTRFDLPAWEVEGFVADVRDAYRRAEIVIAPLVASAGTNIKVLEAMAMGKTVVSTPAGVNGIPVENGRNAIVTETAAGMAQAIRGLSRSDELRSAVERAARLFAEGYGWQRMAARQKELWSSLVSKG